MQQRSLAGHAAEERIAMSKSLFDPATEFVGRRALVTGGSRGIGAAVAQRLLDGGATVAVTARTITPDTPHGAVFIAGDLRSPEGAAAVADEAVRALGGLDILINNAASATPQVGGVTAIPDQEWLDSLDINFLSAVRVTQAALPALRKSDGAVIVNVSSGGATPLPGPIIHYGAAKAALNAYTLGLAQELSPQGIRVNIVTPGPVLSPGGTEIRQTLADAAGIHPDATLAGVPMRRFGEASEVAEMIALLVSPRGSWLTSHNFYVDGGVGAL
jgi:NAD(P)-dependent dehydrogenase (short-subunit alcohol dehydrogenase family)